jgi:hypothetical protein
MSRLVLVNNLTYFGRLLEIGADGDRVYKFLQKKKSGVKDSDN